MNKKAFTLIEIMIGVLILSILIIGGFNAYSGVLIGKIKLIEKTDIQKQAFYFSEKFFEELKKGGTIDYEEYFNRDVVGTSTLSGYYDKITGFGNYGIDGFTGSTNYGKSHYYCRSEDGSTMGTGGCVTSHNTELTTLIGKPQRYGQYAYQFIDYNSNLDLDYDLVNCPSGKEGDENCDGNITGDNDDEYLGEGPNAFSGATNINEVKEVYLISADKKKRTYFRWNIKDDPNSDKPCDSVTGSGACASTIEFLKLEGVDWGKNHSKSGSGVYDGNIDTWLIDKNFVGEADYITNPIVAGSTSDSYWQPLFGDNINVKNVKFFMYPNKDYKLSWRNTDPKINIAPYIRIKMTLVPTYKSRSGIKGKIPEIDINTTVSLSEIYSKN